MMRKSCMQIIGDNIILREIKPEDTNRIIEWRNKDWVRSNFIYQNPFTKESHEKWLKEFQSMQKIVPGTKHLLTIRING